MRVPRLPCLLAALAVLAGCAGPGPAGSGGADRREVAALVRDQAERIEAERGAARRTYIDRRIEKRLAELGHDDARLSALEARVAALGSRVDALSWSAGVEPPDDGAGDGEPALALDTPPGGETTEPEPPLPPLLPLAPPPETPAAAPAGDGAGSAPALATAAEEGALLAARAPPAGEAADEGAGGLDTTTSGMSWPDRPAAEPPAEPPPPAAAEPARAAAPRGLHLASYRTREAALLGWGVFKTKYPGALRVHEPVLVEADTGAGLFVRLFTGVGLAGPALRRLRDEVRAGGDYSEILPLPPGAG